MKKVLIIIMSLLMVCSFSRAMFDRGPLDLLTVLNELSVFDYSLESIFELAEQITTNSFSSFYQWNDDVNFVINIANTITSVLTVFGDLIASVVVVLWGIVSDSIALVVNLVMLFARLFGFVA